MPEKREKVKMGRLSRNLLFGAVLAAVAGCVTQPPEQLDNPEFSQRQALGSVGGGVLEKYSVGDVVVWPRMARRAPGEYALVIGFYSKDGDRSPSVGSVEVAVDGIPVAYEFPLGPPAVDKWYGRRRPGDPCWVCGVAGPVVVPPEGVAMKDARVDVALEVSAPDGKGGEAKKRIQCFFVPYKGDFWTRHSMQGKK